MTYISEKYQLGILRPFLENEYDEYVTEAEIYSIPVDIVARNGDDLITIELKSRDHKRGIEQAVRNSDFADYSYLCVWEDQVTDHLLDRLDSLPIGLIAVDEEVTVIKQGRKLTPNKYAKNAAEAVF